MTTLYDLIGARPDDDAESLKRAYRKAAKANHPDHHAGDPAAVTRFRRINAAYDILRDTEQRAAYDRTLEGWDAPPGATFGHAASPRRRSFVANTIASAAVTLMLGGAFMLFAQVSGISIEDLIGPTMPQADETAAVQPARPAATAQMPIMVPRPGVVTSTANDMAGSEETKDRNASQETRDTTASQDTMDKTTAQDMMDRIASQVKKNRMASQDTTDTTASQDTKDKAASQETEDRTASQDMMNRIASQVAKNRTASQDATDTTASQDTKDRTASQDTKDKTASQDTKDKTASQGTKDTAASRETTDATASRETKDATASQETKDAAASPETKDRTASHEAKDATASQETKDRTASQEAKDTAISAEPKSAWQERKPEPDTTPTPAVEVAKHEVDLDARVNRLSVTERRVPTSPGPYVATPSPRRDFRSDTRTDTRMRDTASTNTNDWPSQRRPSAGSSALEQATLEGGHGSNCSGSRSCLREVPPLFGVGF